MLMGAGTLPLLLALYPLSLSQYLIRFSKKITERLGCLLLSIGFVTAVH